MNTIKNANPIIIKSINDLLKFRDEINAGVTETVYGHFCLGNDIDLNNMQWIPIGNFEKRKPFCGIFDGNGYTISNLSIFDLKAKEVGLFGYIQGAKIKGLTVTGAVTSFRTVAGIAGIANKGSRITCCINNVSVTGHWYVGGIVGNNNAILEDCLNLGAITGENFVGGIAGFSCNSISNCTNLANITGDWNIGGIVGFNNTPITNCRNNGTISSLKFSRDYDSYVYSLVIGDSGTADHIFSNTNVGGIAGHNRNSIFSCNNKGDIFGHDSVGGIVGECSSKSAIKECLALNSNITAMGEDFGRIAGESIPNSVFSNNYANKNMQKNSKIHNWRNENYGASQKNGLDKKTDQYTL